MSQLLYVAITRARLAMIFLEGSKVAVAPFLDTLFSPDGESLVAVLTPQDSEVGLTYALKAPT